MINHCLADDQGRLPLRTARLRRPTDTDRLPHLLDALKDCAGLVLRVSTPTPFTHAREGWMADSRVE